MAPAALVIGSLAAVIALLLAARGVSAIAAGRPCGAERVLAGSAIAALVIVFSEFASSGSGEAGRAWMSTATSFGGRADVGLSFVSGLVAGTVWIVLEIAERMASSRHRIVRAGRWLATLGVGLAVALHVAFVVGVGEVIAVQERLRGPFRLAQGPSGPARVPLFAIGGYPAVRIEIDGRPVDLIVDTGSEGTILSREAARDELSLAPFPWTRWLPLSIHFPLYDRTVPASIHRAGRLELGGFRFDGPLLPSAEFDDFLGLDEDFHGFAGMDLLGGFVATFDYRRKELSLARPTGAEPPEDATVVPAEVVGGRLFLSIWLTIDGRGVSGRHRFLLDTGVSQTIVDPEIAGGGGERRSVRVHFDATRTWFVGTRWRTRDLEGVDGILGHDLLRAYRVTLDPTRRRIWLVPYER